MLISQAHIKKDSKKKIGHINGDPVYELMTIGGLNMVCMIKNTVPKMLAVAPHRAIARKIARNIEPDLIIDELSKSEDLPLAMFEHLVPQWQEITNQLKEILS